MLVPRLPHWGIISTWMDGPASAFEWSENIPLRYPAKRCKRLTTCERKHSDIERGIIQFLILAASPLTISGLAVMLKTGCNRVASAAYTLENAGIIKRAKRSRMIFLKPPRKEEHETWTRTSKKR